MKAINEKSTVKICRQYGLQWNGFKVPYGAIFGKHGGFYFIVTKYPEDKTTTATRLFLWIREERHERWREITGSVYFDKQTEYCYYEGMRVTPDRIQALSDITRVASHIITVYRPKIKGYRPAACKFYTRSDAPHDRQCNNWSHSRGTNCYSQSQVDGAGFDGSTEPGFMKGMRFSPQGNYASKPMGRLESSYWNMSTIKR